MKMSVHEDIDIDGNGTEAVTGIGRCVGRSVKGDRSLWFDGSERAPRMATTGSIQKGRSCCLSPNPPKDTDGRREDSGRGWVRELQGRCPGVLGQMGGRRTVFSRRTGPLRPYAGVAMRGMARGYAAGDSRDRGGARLRGRWVSCRLAVRPGTGWLAAGPRRD